MRMRQERREKIYKNDDDDDVVGRLEMSLILDRQSTSLPDLDSTTIEYEGDWRGDERD